MSLIQYLIISFSILLIVIQTILRYIDNYEVNKLIEENYSIKKLKVIEYFNFSRKDRFRYGVPYGFVQNLMLSLLSLPFQFHSNHYRKIKTIDEDKNTQERIVMIKIRLKKVISFKELAVLDF